MLTIQYTSTSQDWWNRELSLWILPLDIQWIKTLSKLIYHQRTSWSLVPLHQDKFIDILPVLRGSTSRATIKHQARAIDARIVVTIRNEELDFIAIGNTRIADWLRRAASQTETYIREVTNWNSRPQCQCSPSRRSQWQWPTSPEMQKRGER